MAPRVIALFVLLLMPSVNAEQRAYRLNVMKGETKVREVISTLDHIQYPGYYPLNAGESIEYGESWMCWGRSEPFEPACSQPLAESSPTNDQNTPVRKPSSSP